MSVAPRIFGICATEADVVAVLRRGPSSWTHLGLWDLASERFEPGSWLKARVYEEKCDISPDGQYLCYFALNGGSPWAAGATYFAVSRLPWFTAIAAWGTPGTYTGCAYFVKERGQWALAEPDEGDDGPVRRRYGLAMSHDHDFAVERRRGWTEVSASANAVGRQRPGQAKRRDQDVWLVSTRQKRRRPVYELREGPNGAALADLGDIQWADWARDGRLLVATSKGSLQIRDGAVPSAVRWELDLAALRPDPQPSPPQARY